MKNINPWGRVRMKNGKLQGILTDRLAKAAFASTGESTKKFVPTIYKSPVKKRK